jgi:colanic acid biosynthesis glycosyl transferase WcaI
VLQLNDLFPEAAQATGVLNNRLAISLFSAMERFLYRSATHISLISKSFLENLINKGVPVDKITLIPVWADPNAVFPLPKQNQFRNQHLLNEKFVVLYAGNLGLTSSLEEVISAAELLSAEANICFVIVGEGLKKSILKQMARRQKLDNILFLPYQPRKIYPEMLAAADLSLVTLNDRSSLTSLPSKVFNIMASARPVLAVAPLESELAQLVKDADCGVIIPTKHPELLAEEIRKLMHQKQRLDIMGLNGRDQLQKKYARKRCIGMFEDMMQNLCADWPKQKRAVVAFGNAGSHTVDSSEKGV